MTLEGLPHALVGQVADLGEGFGADHGADRDRVGRVEHLARLVPRQERVHLGLSGMSARSLAWVSRNPSMHTITGTDSSSAIRKAWMCRSRASWLVSA